MSRNSKDQLAGCLGDPNANTVEVGDGFFFFCTLDGRLNAFNCWILGSTNDVSPRFTLLKTKIFARANGWAAKDKPFILLQVRPMFRGELLVSGHQLSEFFTYTLVGN